MPLELSTDPSRLTLRDGAESLYAPENIAAQRGREIDASSQFSRGWQSAGMGEDANSLMSKSLAARRNGDEDSGAVYEQQARDLLSQSQQWAPTVQNMTDVTGLRSGLDWAGGALGNLRSSVMPALGGLGGAALGGVGGALVGGVPGAATGARYGASLGAGLLGGKTEYDEAVGNAMMDPTIRSTRSYDDIHNAALVKGGINAGLEALVPAGMTKSVLGLTGKAALKKAAEQGMLKTLGKEVGKNAAEEFGTESAQSLVGQGAENWLKQKDITDFDYKQALNEGAAGAIAGGGMGIVGGAGTAAHAALGSGVDAVKDFTNKTTSDHIADAGAALGRKVGEKDAKQFDLSDDELAAKAKEIVDGLQNQHRDFSTVPTSEASLGDDQKVAAADARAMKHAETIRDNPGDYSQSEREAAAKFMAHKQFGQFDKDLTEAKDNDALNALTAEVENKSPKKSEMSAEGDTAHRLTDLWLERHGSGIGAFSRQKGSDLAKRAATALMGWVNSGYGAAHSEDGKQTFIPRALLDHFGDDAPKIVKTMTELASKQGTMVDKSQIGRVLKEVSTHVDDQTGDHTFLTNKLTPLADAHWTTEKSVRIAKLLRDNHGKANKATQAALKESFGDNVGAVLEHFKPKVKEDIEAHQDGENAATKRVLDQEELDYENEQAAQSTERISEGRRYVGQSKTNEYFDTQNAFHKNQFERMSKEQTAAKGVDDAVGRSAKKVGMIEREIEKAAEANGTTVEDMSQAAKDKITAKIVHEQHPELEKVTKSVKGVSKLAQTDHALRRVAYEKKLAKYAREINSRFQTMRIEETEGTPPGINFTEAEVKALQLDYDLRDPYKVKGAKANGILNPKLSPTLGRIVLERNGKPFVTSTQMLMAKMFGVRDNTTESTKDYNGTAQMALQRVSDAIASVQQHEGFSGRIGVVRNGKIVWVNDLPNDLRLWISKEGVSHTVGTAKGQLSEQSLEGTRPATENEMRHKLSALSANLKDKDLADVRDALKAGGKVLQAEFNKHFPNYRVEENPEFDPDTVDGTRNKRSVYVDEKTGKTKTVEEVDTKPDAGKGNDEGFVGNGTLEDYGTDQIQRDDAGRAIAGSDTMTAGHVVGKQVSVTKAEPHVMPSSKEIAAEQRAAKNFPEKVQDAKDWVVAVARTGVPAMLKQVSNLTAEQTRVLKQALEELIKLGDTKLEALYSLDKDFGSKLNARLTNAYLMLEKKGAYNVARGQEGVGALDKAGRAAEATDGAADKAGAAGEGSADAGESKAGVAADAATSEELDDAIYKEDFSKFNTKEKLLSLAEHAARRDSELEAMDESDGNLSKKEMGVWAITGQFKFEARSFLKNPNNFNGTDFESFFDGIEHTDEDVKDLARAFANIKKPSKPSKQKANGPEASPEQQDEARAAITKIIGDKIKVLFDKKMKSAGSWTPQQTMNMIKLALNGDVLGAAFHESFHEIMDILRKNGGDKSVAILERAAMNPLMQNRLRQALEGHPRAQAQLAKPEEAAAFMFQMWMANPAGFRIGPDTKSLFDQIKGLLRSIAGVVSESVRKANAERKQAGMEALKVEELLRSFGEGALADVATRKAVVEAMDKNVERHNAAVENVGSAFRNLANGAGKLVFSAEAMMDATGSKYMVEIARMFHQKAGTAMKAVGKSFGGYSDGVRQQTSLWLNKAENILMNADKGDIELARQHLSNGTNSTDPKVQKVVTALRGFMNEMRTYIDQKDVRVLDDDHVWQKVKFRNNYWPQVIDMKFLGDHMQEFKDDLLKYHMDALEGIAAKANAEVKNGTDAGANTASELMGAKKPSNRSEITPEHIAEAIATRLLNSQGNIDLAENSSDLGMTPAARAVNRRVLDFLDPSFDKYMSKDVTNIVTNYAHSVVKRAEYQSRFGYGGEKIKELSDKAILHELGGEELIDKSEKILPMRIKAWKKAQAEAKANGVQRDVPFPTLRSVGQSLHKAQVMADVVGKGGSQADGDAKHHEALLKAVKKMEQGTRAIQAMEGTLGNDISAGARAIGSWLVTYQNFRLLSTMLFMSFQDVMGIVREGGEMGDAWKAFTTGISEIKNTWSKTKTHNEMMERSEFWGAVDAGSFADAVAASHGSVYMTGKAKELSDKFFKYTGAEGWNRGVRGVAASVAERIITEWKREGIDTKDKAVQARVARLFGEGFDVANIKMDAQGRLDIADPLNQAAVTRWVLDAVPAPTAAHRPIWGSDPHFQAFMHLKNYTYTFHRVAMKGAVEQAKLGNYRPAAVLALGYVPIAIAAGAMKEMLIPGDEPPWMKGGLDGYLGYGFARAGLLGVPQMYSESLFNPTQLLDHPSKAFDNFDPAALFGPTADQAQNIMSIPFMEDHGVIGESLGSLPGGNLIKRLERIGTTGK